MERTNRERQDEIPSGIFSSRPIFSSLPPPELYLTVRGEEQDHYIDLLSRMLEHLPDRLTISEAAKAIGYSTNRIDSLVDSGELYAVKLYGVYCIPKVQLIAYLATDRAFGIRGKSVWHKNAIQEFIKMQGE